MSDRRSPSRGRSPTPAADEDARSRSQARSVTPRDASQSRSRSRGGAAPANGTRDSRSRSRSRSASRPRSARPTSPDRQPRSAKIVIEKLTKNVNEAHLREIFGSYGDIEDLEMPINRQFLTNRGIAYVLYATPADAESAIAHMHEAQLDGATINVSIVLPRRRFSRSPAPRRPPPNRFGEPHRYREPPPSRPGPERAFGGRGPRGGGGGGGGGRGGQGFRDEDRSYRPRSYSPDRSPPRRRRSPSYDSRSPSRSPPPRRRERSPPRGGAGGRRRSPSYSNASDRSASRDRSRSRDRGGRRR
jgi:RNA-binding protein with serine-rich domain 1